MSDVITIDDTKQQLHILDRVSSSQPCEMWFYDHTGMKTPFSRWLAINRKRKEVRLRHTTKNISRVVTELEQIATQDGVVGYDSGLQMNYMWYFIVTDGAAKSVQPKEVESMKSGTYLLWKS